MRDELGTVVHAQVARRASLEDELIQTFDDVVGGDGASDVNGQALPRELIDDVQQLDGAQVALLVELEVHGPDDVGGDGAHGADDHSDAGEAFLLLAIGDFQALLAPQTMDPLVVHVPTGVVQGVEAASPTPAWVAPGEVAQEGSDLLFVTRRNWRGQALGGATLANDDAGSAFRHPELQFKQRNCLTPAVRGQNFRLSCHSSG